MSKRQKAIDGKIIIRHTKTHQMIIQQTAEKFTCNSFPKLEIEKFQVADDFLDDLFSPRSQSPTQEPEEHITIPPCSLNISFTGSLTQVPIETPSSSYTSEPAINSIPPVPPTVEIQQSTLDLLPRNCLNLTTTINPYKKASMIVGVTDLLMRICKQRITGRDITTIQTPLLTALVASIYNKNDNLKSFIKLGKTCELELFRRYNYSGKRLQTNLGLIKKARGSEKYSTWALLHCFSRCAQCKKHTTLSSDYKHNNGNIRVVQFYTRRCGCALRYCPSCVQNYYMDKSNNSPKDVVCWMCTNNQEYGFDHWMVKVPLETVCAVNQETSQHACCLYEPCIECFGNKRPAEAYFDAENNQKLNELRRNLDICRKGLKPVHKHSNDQCSLCNQLNEDSSFWTFENCSCLLGKPSYHKECAQQVAVCFESTCPFCNQEGYFKYQKTV